MLVHRIALLASPTVLALACSQPTPPARADVLGAVLRPELEHLGQVDVLETEGHRVAAWPDLTDAEATAGWDFGDVETRLQPFQGKDLLVLPRTTSTSIRIPAELHFENTPEVILFGLVRGEGFHAQARLVRDGETVAVGKAALVKSRDVQAFEFAFDHVPTVGGEGLECDGLVLELPKGKLPVGLLSLVVEDLPIGGFLPPEAFGGVALIEQQLDGRRGTLVSSEGGVRTRFRVDDPARWLQFEYAIPNSVAPQITWPELHVELEVDGVVRREVDIQPTTAWGSHGFALEPFVDAEVTATFEVRTDDGGYTLLALTQPKLVRKVENPPTVLLVTSDTHRADHVGFVSGPDGPRTETIDRLAAEGVSFLDTISSINNTTPSHAALLTGLPPRDTGIVSNAKRLAEEAPTLADRFAELGYATIACVSAAPICSEFSGLDQGFDRYSNPGFRSVRDGADTVAQLLEWLPDHEGQPLFVWLHVYDAHAPYDPPAELLHQYYPEDLRPFDPASPVANLALAPDWDTTIADPVYTESLYKGEVHYVDELMGRLLADERLANGVIAFTADHGEALRAEESFRFGHNLLARDTLSIPLVLVAPGLPRGEQRSAPVQQIDVGRTLLDLAGHPEVDFPGRNLLTAEEDDDVLRFALEGNGFSAAVVSGKWMLRLGLRERRNVLDDEGQWFHRAELIDWENDGTASHDLSAEHPELTRELRAALVAWLAEGVRGRWEESPRGDAEDIARQLAELGYTGTDEAVERAKPWIDVNCACPNCKAAR